MSNQPLKPGWKVVRFGDVVHKIQDRVTDLENCGLTEYTRGEHFEPGSLRLIGRSKLGDGLHGSAFHMRFKKGDVLYVSRNPHLRKVAIADYDGICANTSYVCRADNQNLLHELLPFIMQTEDFVEYTIRHKRGSTNFYLNWSDIAPYEFPLPPLDEQRRIAELLWAAEGLNSRYRDLMKAKQSLAKSRISSLIKSFSEKKYIYMVKDLLTDKPKNGYSPKANESGKGYRTVSISAISNGKFIPEGNIKFADVDYQKISAYSIRKNDVFVVRGNGNRYLAGKCGIASKSYADMFYPDLLIRLRFDCSIIDPMFATLQWNDAYVHRDFISRAKSTNGIWKVNGQDIRKHTLVIPPLDEQKKFLSEINIYKNAIKDLENRREQVLKIKSHLLNTHL